jgi:hypothetical protein
MEAFERKALSTIVNPPAFWYRYVDDTLTSRKENQVKSFTDHLNSIDSNIQFTVEVEKGGKISFLDTLLERSEDGSLKTSVYRKPTHTDQYLNFNSHHPLEHKRSVVRTLFHRADTLSADEHKKGAERQHVREALSKNGYPKWMFNTPAPRKPVKEDDSDISVGLPYIKGLSERLARTFRQHGARVFHRPTNSLRSQLTRVKDKTEKTKVCGSVYYIQCADCNEDYIGESERPFLKRFKEHQARSDSAFHCHLASTDHGLDLDRTSLLTTESHPIKRKIKEAIEIKLRKPSLNRDSGVELPAVYDRLIGRLTADQPLTDP